MAAPPHSPADPGQPDDAGGLSGLLTRPFRLIRPREQTIPFIFASPHSGRNYPRAMTAASGLTPLMLRRSEDAFVDELFAGVVELGAPLLAAEFPRAFLDVNRGPGEIDAAMFDPPLTVKVEAPTSRVTAGLGVIPRIVRDGADIYRGKLPPDEAARRLEGLYKPYHAALGALVEETHARFGLAVLVDCHSMPSSLNAPDIVLGDRYGASASALLSRLAQESFLREGFRVARNTPYAGGHTTSFYGRADIGRHALQIEVNRGLYLDEERIVRKDCFEKVRMRLTAAMLRLTRHTHALLGGSDGLAAAE